MPTAKTHEPMTMQNEDDKAYVGFGAAMTPVAVRRQFRMSLGLAGVFALVALGVATAASFDGVNRVEQDYARYKASRTVDATFAGSLPVIR